MGLSFCTPYVIIFIEITSHNGRQWYFCTKCGRNRWWVCTHKDSTHCTSNDDTYSYHADKSNNGMYASSICYDRKPIDIKGPKALGHTA